MSNSKRCKALLRRAEKFGELSGCESVPCDELYLIREIARAASDHYMSRKSRSFRSLYSIDETQRELDAAIEAYDTWLYEQ